MPSLRNTGVELYKWLLGKFYRNSEISTELPHTTKFPEEMIIMASEHFDPRCNSEEVLNW
jgi:hypothetical protein